MVEQMKGAQLAVEAKAGSGSAARLEKRAAELDRELGRLVKAIVKLRV